MNIKACQIRNYKCFTDSGLINFAPGFNVVVGQNSVGKTALIEALSLVFPDKPHRSLRSAPSDTSTIGIDIEVTPEEVFEGFRSAGAVGLPLRDGEHVSQAIDRLSFYLKRGPTLHAEVGPIGTQPRTQFAGFSLHGGPGRVGVSPTNGQLQALPAGHALRPFDLLPDAILARLNTRIYAFRAERLNISKCPIALNSRLAPDCSNLPEVLHLLQSKNKARFSRFIADVQTVFPDVMDIAVAPITANTVEISVWFVDPKTERQDLAIPLADCGTGLGQVLALLYVAITAELPHVILIDEPQSFLHPGAIRKLFEIFKREIHQKHQFIVTTHSPVVVTAASPCTVVLLRRCGGESKAETIDIHATSDLRLFLSEIGARLSDVFGADRILWVEGKTEEICFRRIVQKTPGLELQGTEIIGVSHVGDLEGRHKEAILEIYQKLCSARGLLPPAIAFCFDQEGRAQSKREQLAKESNGLIQFIPRRMYENYLLNPAAIAAALSEADKDRSSPVTAKDVNVAVKRLQQSAAYASVQASGQWETNVHAANLLRDLFSELSETRVAYDKLRHGVKLTEWILEHNPEELSELVDFLTSILRLK